MALSRFLSLRNMTRSFDRLRDLFGSKPQQEGRTLKHRQLLMDPLEERQLLSLTAGDLGDTQVNESVLDVYDTTRTSHSIAVDNDGDFVVAWTQYDPSMSVDPITGELTPRIDPVTGLPRTDANIHARYFTDEVQRITLPDEVLTDNVSSVARYSLQYGGNEVQKITISTAYEPYTYYQETVVGQFMLGLDIDGSGVVDADESTMLINYNEYDSLDEIAAEIQENLRGAGPFELTDVVVEGLNPREFLVHFGDHSGGQDMPQLVTVPLNTSFTYGFLPAVTIETISSPVDLSDIPVVPGDPSRTALSMADAFLATYDQYLLAPIFFPPPDRVPNPTEGPYPLGTIPDQPVMATGQPTVSVVPVLGIPGHADGTVFDVTFVGASGKKDHPELVLTHVEDERGNPLTVSTAVETLKEPSPQFRVNPAEPIDPYITYGRDKFDQTNPSVAIDADGEFVIAWESEVPDSQVFLSVSDVFARRFTVTGLVEPGEEVYYVDHDGDGEVLETPIQGIRALVSPEARVSEILTLNTGSASSVSGLFRLQIGSHITDDILFDTSNVTQVATDIEEAIEDQEFANVSVTLISSTNPYRFQIEYDVTYGGLNLAEDMLIEYVAGTDQNLSATASVQNNSGDLLTWRVNQNSSNAQGQPAVGMDDAGNFVIAWANSGQPLSFFNGVYAQRYNREGTRLGTEFAVGQEDTAVHDTPYVAMSADGHCSITWDRTEDTAIVVTNAPATRVLAKVYDPDGVQLLGGNAGLAIGGGGNSSSAFDDGNNFVVCWSVAGGDSDNIGANSSSVLAKKFDITGTVIREDADGGGFRANSATFDKANVAPLWPLTQDFAQAAVDADGDLTIAFEGFGPDTAEDGVVDYPWFSDLINDDQNADLLPFFDPSYEELPISWYTSAGEFYYNDGADADGVVDEVLIRASVDGATDEQLGRLNVILNKYVNLMRGEANGILFSQFDADPTLNSQLTALYSDSVINAERSGHNHKEMIVIDETVNAGSLTMRLWHGYLAGYVNVTFSVVTYPNSTLIDMYKTRDNIEAAFEGAVRTGVQWIDTPVTRYEGPIDVRIIDSYEIADRMGTPWEIEEGYFTPASINDYVWEITFQGEVHDTPMMLSVAPNGNKLTSPQIAEVQTLSFAVTTDGLFALSVGNQTTGDIQFDSNNPTAVAGQIQTELQGAGLGGTTVTYDLGTTYDFTVTFAGASAGVDQPPIQSAAITSTTGTPIVGQIFSTEVTQGSKPGAPYPSVDMYNDGYSGIEQGALSIGMEPDGDFTAVWTQYEESSSGFLTNNSIQYRRFDELTDTAGPRVTDVIDSSGNLVEDGGEIVGPVSHVILTFDEDMMSQGLDSVTNPDNYRLLANGIEVVGGVVHIEYGMNRAADLEGVVDPITGELYDLDFSRPNKWQAILTIDGNGEVPGIDPLYPGVYSIEAIAPVQATATVTGNTGLRDRAGNPLGETGFTPGGLDSSQGFVVVTGTVLPPTPPPAGSGENGRTYIESAKAVAVDADGNHVMVWTATDPSGVDRVYMGMYDADGTAIDLPVLNAAGVPATDTNGNTIYATTTTMPVTPVSTHPELAGEQQMYATVAIDGDGDFVVTWTQYQKAVDSVSGRQLFYHPNDGSNFAGTLIVYDPADGKYYDFSTQAERNLGNLGPIDLETLGLAYYDANIFARRFNSTGWFKGVDTDGNLIGQDSSSIVGTSHAFPVNVYGTQDVLVSDELTEWATLSDQKWSHVAVDVDGDFVITWSSDGQEGNGQGSTGYGIYARRFDAEGEPLALEFQVNETTTGNQQHSSIGMGYDGGFIIAWTSSANGIDDDIVARGYHANGSSYPLDPAITPAAGGNEFVVNTTLTGNQRYPNVDTDLSGGKFVVTWSSSAQDGSGYGVYARTFSLLAPGGGTSVDTGLITPASAELQVNTTTIWNQMYSSVAMDHDGEFTVTWSGYGNQRGEEDTSQFGVYYQRFLDDGTRDTSQPTEILVNRNTAGAQWMSSIGVDGEGNLVIVWTGPRKTDPTLTYVDKFLTSSSLPVIDDDGPVVTGVQLVDGTRILDNDNVVVPAEGVSQLVVVFGENMSTVNGANGLESILNPLNWSLEHNGSMMNQAIVGVEFGFNLAFDLGLQDAPSNKYEALLTFDGNGPSPGQGPLPDGTYVMTVNGLLTDGRNSLDGDYDGVPGENYELTFYLGDGGPIGGGGGGAGPPGPPEDSSAQQLVNTTEDNDQHEPAIASDDEGNFVVVWTSDSLDTLGVLQSDIMGQRFNRFNEKEGAEFVVNVSTDGNQSLPDVAMDPDGNFVVVWSGEGDDETEGIYGRLFSANGSPKSNFDFHINQYTENQQEDPAVAMDANGDFVVTWTSYGQFDDFDFDKKDIYARRFSAYARPLSNEFQVNTHFANHQRDSDVAMDDQGNFVAVWIAYRHPTDDNEWGVYGQRFDSLGNMLGAEFRVNSTVSDSQHDPHVAMDADGDFAVVWSSDHTYDVYAKRYNAAGVAQEIQGTTEFRVNESRLSSGATPSWQYMPDVSMSDDGLFVVTWTAYDQEQTIANADDDDGSVDPGVDEDTHDYGVFARILLPDGSDYIDADSSSRPGIPHPITGVPMNEFQINAVRADDQQHPVIALDADGDFSVAWVSPDIDGLGVYDRTMHLNRSDIDTNPTSSIIEDPATQTLTVLGSDSVDQIEVDATQLDSAEQQFTVDINGFQKQYSLAEFNQVFFDGLTGNDSAVILGSTSNDIATIQPGAVLFTGGGLTVDVSGTENISVNGGGGNDRANLHDSAGDDSVVMTPLNATMTGPGFQNTTEQFERIYAYAKNGGTDVAEMSGLESEAETFILDASYQMSKIVTSDYTIRSKFFEEVTVDATGSNDRAKLKDSDNDDLFEGWHDHAIISGPGYSVQVNAFNQVHAYAKARAKRGIDVARLYGTPGADKYVATSVYSKMFGLSGNPDQYTLRAKFFEEVYGDAGDGQDEVKFLDSAGNDDLIAQDDWVQMSNDDDSLTYDYLTKVINVESGRATSSNGGSDTKDSTVDWLMYYGDWAD